MASPCRWHSRGCAGPPDHADGCPGSRWEQMGDTARDPAVNQRLVRKGVLTDADMAWASSHLAARARARQETSP